MSYKKELIYLTTVCLCVLTMLNILLVAYAWKFMLEASYGYMVFLLILDIGITDVLLLMVIKPMILEARGPDGY